MCLSKTNVSANLSAKRYLNSKNLALEFPRIITSLGSTVEGSKASEDQDEGAEKGWHIIFLHLPIRAPLCAWGPQFQHFPFWRGV